MPVSQEKEVVGILDVVLSLQGRANSFQRDTPLLGALPELDSMAVLGIMTMLEDRFGFSIHDDEIDGSVFATLGSLADFVEAKLAAH
ncbi:MAG: acyl carrier protein [Rhodoferax sp.]